VIRVVLVDDHTALREPLALLLGLQPDMQVVGQASTLAEARRLLNADAEVDVAVVDLDLPDGSGIDLILEICAAGSAGSVLVLSASTGEQLMARAVQAGAMGVLSKATPIPDLIAAIRELSSGRSLLPPVEMIRLLRAANQLREREHDAKALLARLTQREREVLQALGDGLSDKEIAERLSVNSKTVRVHVANLLAKLDQRSRLQAVLFAARHGALEIR
jgi:DNA-binding NarL/FixJ family response regulator